MSESTRDPSRDPDRAPDRAPNQEAIGAGLESGGPDVPGASNAPAAKTPEEQAPDVSKDDVGKDPSGDAIFASLGAEPHSKQPAEGAATVGDDEDPDSDSADQRLAKLLSGTSSHADLRRKLQGEESEEADDLLSRLNALDFVQQVVGGHSELPDRIGGYDIKGLLGRGGMGIVYLGWQEDLEREVALKFLSHNYTADPTMRKRFRAEARATAALHHRHIVPIYDYGEANGMLFFAMERVNGLSLDKHISSARRVDKKPLEVLDAARRFAGVADALGLAHRRRLLHRDVKPGNILVGEDGTMALTDFGLAKALDHASMQLTSKGGGFLGTLHYASPEQALGSELTPASDLYSLGVTMFEAVTGHLPLAGKTTEALLQSILHGTPARLREYITKPPRDFEAVLDKLLARDADDRYQDGEALSRDLVRIADGDPVRIRRLPLHVRLWRRARKNPVLASALVAVFILILSTGTLAGVLNKERGKGRVSRHQETLVSIAKDVGRARGPEFGPLPLLRALTGVEVPPRDPNAAILLQLNAADEAMPDDERAHAMLRAYIQDPLAHAAEYLRVGRGFEALQLYDAEIQRETLQNTSGKLAVELRLYRLYLARAVANLTQSVGRAYDARIDLALASYLRPGAAFPLALIDVLDLVQSQDVEADADALKKKVTAESVPLDHVRTVALLLWAAAGQRPHMMCNMMSFSLDFAHRSTLHALAADLLGEDLEGCGAYGETSGLASSFAKHGRTAIGLLGEPAAFGLHVKQASKAIQLAAHPESALQGWRHLLQLVTPPSQRGPLVDEQQRPLPPAVQLSAWRALVSLRPTSMLTNLWLDRFNEFRRLHPGEPGIAAVGARLHSLAKSPDALRWASDWVIVADGDPDAFMSRLKVLARMDRLQEARDDAIVIAQSSPNQIPAMQRIVEAFQSAAQDAGPTAAEGLMLMVNQFQTLIQEAALRNRGR
ncbi:MAG: serine/threonine protein kinase [Planctomycetota bacterium]